MCNSHVIMCNIYVCVCVYVHWMPELGQIPWFRNREKRDREREQAPETKKERELAG